MRMAAETQSSPTVSRVISLSSASLRLCGPFHSAFFVTQIRQAMISFCVLVSRSRSLSHIFGSRALFSFASTRKSCFFIWRLVLNEKVGAS